MSKQTNDFQRLVRMIQQALAPAGAKITESAMVDNQGHMREIDVLLEAPLGTYQMKVAVEVKDHARPLGPQVIEEYIGKYRQGDGIPVNQVVVVSHSGFTRSAKDKAERANIILLTLKEAHTADWKQYVRPNSNQTLRFQMQPHFHKIDLDPPVDVDIKKALATGCVVCDCCGKSNGSLGRFISKQVQRRIEAEASFRSRITDALKARGGSVLAHLTLCAHGKTLHIDDKQIALNHIKADLHFTAANVPLHFQLYEQTDSAGRSRLVQHAVARVAGKKIQMLFPDGLASKKITIDISEDSSCQSHVSAACTDKSE